MILDRDRLRDVADFAVTVEEAAEARARHDARARRWWDLAAGTPDTPCDRCGTPLHSCELREGWTLCVVCATKISPGNGRGSAPGGHPGAASQGRPVDASPASRSTLTSEEGT